MKIKCNCVLMLQILLSLSICSFSTYKNNVPLQGKMTLNKDRNRQAR